MLAGIKLSLKGIEKLGNLPPSGVVWLLHTGAPENALWHVMEYKKKKKEDYIYINMDV